MKVVQCWDDGVWSDIPLIEVFKKYGAKATFNLSMGLHEKERTIPWDFNGVPVGRLALNELKEVYEGFRIANHSLTHQRLAEMPIEAARVEIVEGRRRLQDFFQQEVAGFAYPYGNYNDAVKQVLRQTGHCYARMTRNTDNPYPPADAMEFAASCHFLAPDFMSRYERAKECGVFYFWGHSYEMISPAMWDDFERKIKFISEDPDSEWANVIDLFR